MAAVLGLLMVVGSGITFARPQQQDEEEFSSAEARRRALDGQDMFDPNPIYTYNYQVSNDLEQTYIAQKESRDGDAVSGEYSYVDALGNLVTVKYTANDNDGYTETREIQENFVQIRAKPVKVVKTEAVSNVQVESSSDNDLVARIIAQLSPFIKQTVASTLSSQQQLSSVAVSQPAVSQQLVTRRRVVTAVPAAAAVESRFGTGAGNNIRVETPVYQFVTDL